MRPHDDEDYPDPKDMPVHDPDKPYKDAEGFTTPPDGTCRCHRRWQQVLAMKIVDGVAKPLDSYESDTGHSIFFVVWYPEEGPWPFNPARTRKMVYTFPFTRFGVEAIPPDPPLVLTAHIGIARCECGNIILYGDHINTSWGGSLTQVVALLPPGAGKTIKETMWARTLDIMPDLREAAFKLPWPWFPEKHE